MPMETSKLSKYVQDMLDSVERKLAGAKAVELRDLSERIVEAVRPEIRQMLVDNYKKSGLKERTGKMLSACRTARVEIKKTRKGYSIIISSPPGINPYGNADSFYPALAAQNYGAVYNTSLDRKDKLKAKSVATGKKLAAGLGGGYVTKATDTGGNVNLSNGARVSKPRNFFELDKDQAKKIQKIAENIMRENAKRELGES